MSRVAVAILLLSLACNSGEVASPRRESQVVTSQPVDVDQSTALARMDASLQASAAMFARFETEVSAVRGDVKGVESKVDAVTGDIAGIKGDVSGVKIQKTYGSDPWAVRLAVGGSLIMPAVWAFARAHRGYSNWRVRRRAWRAMTR